MSVVLAYKNFAANRNISHIGLGVAAINTAKVLRRENIKTDVSPILNAADLRQKLNSAPAKHVIVSAPWIPTADLQALSNGFPDTHFAVNCHSNVGFLQADRNGVKLMREVMELKTGTSNVHMAGNSRRFCSWVKSAFGVPCAYLPNLYYLDGYQARQMPWRGGTLRIGVFGATRPLKNLMSAAGAALEIRAACAPRSNYGFQAAGPKAAATPSWRRSERWSARSRASVCIRMAGNPGRTSARRLLTCISCCSPATPNRSTWLRQTASPKAFHPLCRRPSTGLRMTGRPMSTTCSISRVPGADCSTMNMLPMRATPH